MRQSVLFLGAAALIGAIVAGCSSSSSGPAADSSGGEATAEGRKFLLAAEPAGAKGVKQVRAGVKADDEIIVEGRIGGAVDKMAADAAYFEIVDTSLVPCSERPGDTCTTPWDYCCDASEFPAAKLTVKLVDDAKQLLPTGAGKLLGVKELDTVVVRGAAQVDAAGNLVAIVAKGVYVKKRA